MSRKDWGPKANRVTAVDVIAWFFIGLAGIVALASVVTVLFLLVSAILALAKLIGWLA